MSSNRKREHWRNAERHYCAVCNAWMGSDRQSIMLHENGKKHKENVEKSLDKKRSNKAKEEKDQNFLMASLQKMEQAAVQSHLQQDSMVSSAILGWAPAVPSSSIPMPPRVTTGPNSMVPPRPTSSSSSSKQEKKEWQARKKKRQEEKNDKSSEETAPKPERRKIGPGEGHYESNGKTYLEGPVFFEIIEEEMPVQIWTGPTLATAEEKRLIERDMYWKNALAVAVRKNKDNCKVHAAYLASPDDDEETLEKNVAVDRIRLLLGSDASIPDTIEEALLIAMGGEEFQVKGPQLAQVDEATGLTGWSTVTIKRTTVRQELKEERARLRDERKQAILKKEAEKKEVEARRMEEAKVANADDSALGAYDVWGKGGYKGVDISAGDNTITVTDTAKSLATGKTSVAFKKKKKKCISKNRRTTSADDD